MSKSTNAKTEAVTDRMHILCAADRAYGPWLGVMLTSVLEIDHGRPLSIYLLSDQIRPLDLNRLVKLCRDHGALLHIRDVSDLLEGEGRNFYTSQYITKAAYARIFFDVVFPEFPDRVLYLDSDIVCMGSLQALWEIDVDGAIVAAVPDVASRNPARLADINRRLALPETATYHNSGVLLIDCRKWHTQDIGRALAQYIDEMGDKLGGHDQDAINKVLHERLLTLPEKWNFAAGREAKPDGCEVLIHFIGTRKPWDIDCPSPLAKHFLAAKARSPWHRKLRLPYKIRRLPLSFRKRKARWMRLFGSGPSR